jgi:hypothetical protein
MNELPGLDEPMALYEVYELGLRRGRPLPVWICGRAWVV